MILLVVMSLTVFAEQMKSMLFAEEMKPMLDPTPSDVVASIQLNKDGSIVVVDASGKEVTDVMTLEKVNERLKVELEKSHLKAWHAISVITTNPCTIINIGGQYKQVCW